MSSGAVVIIVIAVIVVAAAVGWAMTVTRRRRLQRKFGPEYDRVASEQPSRRKADQALAARERRVRGLNIRPLDPAARSQYAARWSAVQERFVDEPAAAVGEAHHLVVAVMRDRGYPTDDNDQLADDLSVEHANTLLNYRQASAISEKSAAGDASTEDLRQAMIHYRLLFDDLLGGGAQQGTRTGATPAAEMRAGTGPSAGVSAGPAAARNTAVAAAEPNGAASATEQARMADRTAGTDEAGTDEAYPDDYQDYQEPATDGEPIDEPVQRGRRR